MQLKIGEKIKSLRKEKNISQEVLAQYLGVTFQAVSKWENNAALPAVRYRNTDPAKGEQIPDGREPRRRGEIRRLPHPLPDP